VVEKNPETIVATNSNSFILLVFLMNKTPTQSPWRIRRGNSSRFVLKYQPAIISLPPEGSEK